MTVGELLMELLKATTEGGVPEDAQVVLVVARSNTGNLDSIVVGRANKSQAAFVLLKGSA